jgi:hypothetical protein
MPKGVYERRYSAARKMPRPNLVVETEEQLAEKLLYDQETGDLTWKTSGKKAGALNNGYLRVGKHGVYAHRLAYFKMTGEWPEEVDHINGNKLDNRWDNLRLCNHQQNTWNISAQKNNKSTGIKHVSKLKTGYDVRVGDSFRAYVKDFNEACRLAKLKSQEIYGEFANG